VLISAGLAAELAIKNRRGSDSAGDVLGHVDQELMLPVANVASTCNQLRMDPRQATPKSSPRRYMSMAKSPDSIRAMERRRRRSGRSARPPGCVAQSPLPLPTRLPTR